MPDLPDPASTFPSNGVLVSQMIGQTLDGRYEITKLLGRGGMGVVYLACDEDSSREVVVKMIAPVLRDDE